MSAEKKPGALSAAGAVKEGVLAAAPGLKNFGPQVGAELKRQGVQGSAELASALFTGQSYVPYGSGQNVDLDGNEPVAAAEAPGPLTKEKMAEMNGRVTSYDFPRGEKVSMDEMKTYGDGRTPPDEMKHGMRM